MASEVWCPGCKISGQPKVNQHRSEHYETVHLPAERFVPARSITERITDVRTSYYCAACGARLEDLAAETQAAYRRRWLGRKAPGTLGFICALLSFSSCAASCGGWERGGWAGGALAAILVWPIVSLFVSSHPGAWPFAVGVVGVLSVAFYARFHLEVPVPTSAASTQRQAVAEKVTFADTCNAREGPDQSAKVVGSVRAKTSYSRLGAVNGWTRVELAPGKTGWVGCKTN